LNCSSDKLYTTASKTSSSTATYEQLKQQFYNEKYFTLYREVKITYTEDKDSQKLQIPLDCLSQVDSSKFVLKEKLSAGCFGEVYSCLYDGQELVCKITKHIDYHELLVNELKEGEQADREYLETLMKSSNITKISEEDLDKYMHHVDNFGDSSIKNPIPDRSKLNLDIFPKYYGFFFSASLNKCVMLFERLKMTLEQYIRMIKTREELTFILEEIFNMWKTLIRSNLRHFDIKPDNIMLDYNHKLKLVDLGLLSFNYFYFLPRKSIYYPMTYNERDTTDNFAFAITILNILLYLNQEKVRAVIGDEVVNRSNVEAKLKQLGIVWHESYRREMSVYRFKKLILSLLE
jgi:serine/threonine protein kinase